MPAKTGIRNGLAYGWSLGENNWNTGMDGNLTFIDRFGIHLSFKSFLDTPPGSPTAGDCYVVDSAPTGAWVGKVGQVAVYDDGAWRYGVPRTGWQAYCEADEGRYVFDGAWNLLAVGDISGLTAALAGKADLVGGVVPSNQLPSYVDDVIEVADFASLPATGETGKIYVTLADNNSWRWTGSTYQKVSQPLDEMPQDVAEAGTSETLYASTSRRIRQAIAAWWLTASSAFGRTLANVADAAAGRTALGLGNVDNTSDASKPVSTAQQTALDGKEPAIAAGTSAQFWRGNKTWADFATTVRDAALTGLSTASAAVVTAADSVLVAIGKLQAQISDVVTQTDAEAGTATAVKAWTSLRVRQAWTAAWNAARTSLAAINSSAITEANVAVVVQTDIGTEDNQIPLNAYLGGLAYMSPERVVLKPQSAVTPAAPGDMAFELTNNTTLTIRVRGSDGTVRSTALTLA